jgi:hypothetical protein
MTRAILPPSAGEHSPYYGRYIELVPAGDLLAALAAQPGQLRDLLGALGEEAAGFRPGPDEWSVARGDHGPLPGADPDAYMREAGFDARPLVELLEEFELLRRANVLVFGALAPEHTLRVGTASGSPMSVRALLYLLAGHVIWHMRSLREDYLARMP